jgi:hypothetical protein
MVDISQISQIFKIYEIVSTHLKKQPLYIWAAFN